MDDVTAGWQPGAAPSGVLPRSALLGRDGDADRLHERCVESRLVSLLGAGGTGKTSLAAAVAPGAASQVGATAWWVDLQKLPPGGDVAPALGDVLSIDVAGAASHIGRLVERLGDRPVLLVLDNCEHLVEPVAAMLEELLPACSRLRVLATSREVLGVVGEVPVRLPPLSVPDVTGIPHPTVLRDHASTALFLRQAGLDADTLDAHQRAAVAAVCRELDGMPLAIELAAARSPALTPSQIEAALVDRFRVLTSRRRTVAGRQQTLEASIAWSYDLLDPDEQQLLRSLAVFPAGFDLVGAAIVGAGGDEHAALELVEALLDKSLVAIQERPSGRRFRLQESVRAFAERQLAERGELAAARDRHLEATASRLRRLQLSEEHEGLVLRGEPWLLEEFDDVRAAATRAIETGRGAEAVDLWWAVSIWANVHRREHAPWNGVEPVDAAGLDDGRRIRREIMLSLSGQGGIGDIFPGDPVRAARVVEELWDGDTPDPDRPLTAISARLALLLEESMLADGDTAGLVAGARTVLDIVDAHPAWGDFMRVVTAIAVSQVLDFTGHADEACRVAARGAELATGMPELRALCLFRAAATAAQCADPAASEHLEAALALSHPSQENSRAWIVAQVGVLVSLATGDLPMLEELRARHCQYVGAVGSRPWMLVRWLDATIADQRGDPATALALIEPVAETAVHNPLDEVRYRTTRAHALLGCGRVDEALTETDRARALIGTSDTTLAGALTDLYRAAALLRSGRFEDTLDMAIETAGPVLDHAPMLLPYLAVVIARAQAGTDHAEHGAHTLGVLAADLAARDAALWPTWDHERETATTACRDALGDEVFDGAFIAGGELGWEDWAAWLTRGRGERVTERPAAGWAALTDAEVEVATRAAEGLSNAELAEALFVSVNTVKTHVRNIYTKLDVHSRVELAGVLDEHDGDG